MITLILMLVSTGWASGVVLCLHSDGSEHIANKSKLVNNALCNGHSCGDSSSLSRSCLESNDCIDIVLSGGSELFIKNSNLRLLIESTPIDGSVLWTYALSLPALADVSSATAPRAPPEYHKCVHISIASTIIRI